MATVCCRDIAAYTSAAVSITVVAFCGHISVSASHNSIRSVDPISADVGGCGRTGGRWP